MISGQGIVGTIKKVFKKRGPVVLYQMGGGWGNRIEWADVRQRRVVGWKQRKPEIGDLIECPMKSGRQGILKIVEIEHCLDPHDMFFATVEDFGYKSDLSAEFTQEHEKQGISFLV